MPGGWRSPFFWQRRWQVARLIDAGDLIAAAEELEKLAARDHRQNRVEVHRERLRSLLGSSAADPEKVVDVPGR